MFVNRFNKPAEIRDISNHRAKMDNPLDMLEYAGNISSDAFAEMAEILNTFKKCDAGEIKGPFAVSSNVFFTIVFESFDQREAFKSAMFLQNHGDQYWDTAALDGTLDLLKAGSLSASPFAARPNPFLKSSTAPMVPEKPESKYSDLRAEVKKTAEKMKRYVDDRTWISVCAPDQKTIDKFFKKWALPADKYIHVDDFVASVQKSGIKITVPAVPFGLRATHRSDAALLNFVS